MRATMFKPGDRVFKPGDRVRVLYNEHGWKRGTVVMRRVLGRGHVFWDVCLDGPGNVYLTRSSNSIRRLSAIERLGEIA